MRKRLVLFLAVGLGFMACSGGTVSSDASRKGTAEARTPGKQNSLSAAGEQELRCLVESGHLADLQWPNFTERRDAVKEFYDLAGYRLAWSQAGKPTAQATELIGILEGADQKGLDNKDHDRARWPERQHSLGYSRALADGVKPFQLRDGLDASVKPGQQSVTDLTQPISSLVDRPAR